jgi:E3 ubiquitin-protein ligase TRIP12
MLEDRYTEIERENRILLEKMTGIMNKGGLSSSLQPPKRSLNRDQRKRDLLKITMENQAILKRLQDSTSNYNVYKWEDEEQRRKHMLQNICEYNYVLD